MDVLDAHQRRREVRGQRAVLVDRGLQHFADVADQAALAEQLGAGLDLLRLVGDHIVGQGGEFPPDRFRGRGAIRGRVRVGVGFEAGDDRPRGNAGEQLVGRLVLERGDLGNAPERSVVVAVEHVELRELAQYLAPRGLVLDVVLREDAREVAAHLPGEGPELRIVADHVLGFGVELIAEAR